MQYILYAIGSIDDLVEPYDKCYIGVTNNPEKRWKSHIKSKYTIGKYIRDNNLNFDDNMIILFYGSSDTCYNKERIYRPNPNMGLNEAIGGNGGYSSYNVERNLKVSSALKGRNVHWIDKVIKSRGSYAGSKNPRAKCWVITDPNGIEYETVGNLSAFCEKNSLLNSTLCYYKGKKVPPILNETYGGFRAKNEKSKLLRHNTTGWMLNVKDS